MCGRSRLEESRERSIAPGVLRAVSVLHETSFGAATSSTESASRCFSRRFPGFRAFSICESGTAMQRTSDVRQCSVCWPMPCQRQASPSLSRPPAPAARRSLQLLGRADDFLAHGVVVDMPSGSRRHALREREKAADGQEGA